MSDFRYKPTPTGARLLASNGFVKVIMGPVGSGKSTIAFVDLVNRAYAQRPHAGVRRSKWGILRNTSAQLRSTVKPLIDQWAPLMFGSAGSWRLTDGTYEVMAKLPDGTVLHAEFVMLAADTPDDVRRLLSLELSGGWIEEAREIDEDVTNGFIGRMDRFPNQASGGVTRPGCVASTNPPPLGTYWHEIITAPPTGFEVFVQPPALLEDGSLNPDAENLENLSPNYYERLVEGRKPAWIDVYLKNKFGPGEWGLPVYRDVFKRDFHVAKNRLMPVMQSINPLIVGMDNGLTAAATIMQMDLRGRVNVLGIEYVPQGETMGVERFLDTKLVPRLLRDFPFRKENIVFELDPACYQRSQVNEATIAQAVAKRGFRTHEATTNDPLLRIGALENLLMRQIDGGAAFLIDPQCTWLADALDWGYRYRKQTAASPSPTIDKNHYSHIAESAQYACLRYSQTSLGGVDQRSQARPVQARTYTYV